MIPLYKGKDGENECENYRGMSLLNIIAGKVCGNIVTERMQVTELLKSKMVVEKC